MKIIFIGSVKFSGIILKYLIQKKAEIVAVCTKETSNFNSDHLDLSSIATDNNIPVKYTIDINAKQNVDWIALSFVRNSKDLSILKKLIETNSSQKIPIIAKFIYTHNFNNNTLSIFY